jgi:hypothetical protein
MSDPQTLRRIEALERTLSALQTRERSAVSGARVYNSADITLTTGAAAALTFNSERYDDADYHSTSSNTSRLTIPQPGRYRVGASVVFASNATGYREIYLQASSGATRIADMLIPAVSGNSTRLVVMTEWEFAASDYVEVYAFQNSGGNLNVTSASAYSPEFWISRI